MTEAPRSAQTPGVCRGRPCIKDVGGIGRGGAEVAIRTPCLRERVESVTPGIDGTVAPCARSWESCCPIQGTSQSSNLRLGMFWKCWVLWVTSVRSWARATAAIIKSTAFRWMPWCLSHPLSLPNSSARFLRNPAIPRLSAAHRWPGKEVALPPPPPLRTARESFPSCSSSLHERPSQDAAAFVSRSWTWICR